MSSASLDLMRTADLVCEHRLDGRVDLAPDRAEDWTPADLADTLRGIADQIEQGAATADHDADGVHVAWTRAEEWARG